MPKLTRQPRPTRGRPPGATSFDPISAGVFGQIVRQTRLESGISQEALALRADIERSYYGRIERGDSQPTLYVILKVASALGVAAGALIGAVETELLAKRISSFRDEISK